jgi:hypothetical protein
MASVKFEGVELTDAMTPTERFNAISRQLGGAQVQPAATRDPWMERWKSYSAGDQTLALLQKNEERIAAGLPPLRADGTEIVAIDPRLPPAVPVMGSSALDEFFKS